MNISFIPLSRKFTLIAYNIMCPLSILGKNYSYTPISMSYYRRVFYISIFAGLSDVLKNSDKSQLLSCQLNANFNRQCISLIAKYSRTPGVKGREKVTKVLFKHIHVVRQLKPLEKNISNDLYIILINETLNTSRSSFIQ